MNKRITLSELESKILNRALCRWEEDFQMTMDEEDQEIAYQLLDTLRSKLMWIKEVRNDD